MWRARGPGVFLIFLLATFLLTTSGVDAQDRAGTIAGRVNDSGH